MERLRSSYDIDGCFVEMIFDAERRRFTVASRYANLAHIPLLGLRSHAKRLAHERASAVFEVVCINGATLDVAAGAKALAMKLRLSQFSCAAYMERELIRRFNKKARDDAAQARNRSTPTGEPHEQ